MLKVMAGDMFNLRVSSWYKTNGAAPGTPVSPLTDIVTALSNGVPAISGGKVLSGQLTNTVLNPSVTNFLTNRDASTVTTRPKAYLNWVLFDEQFQYVASSSGFEQVPDETYYNNTTSTPRNYSHTKTSLPVTKNGYLYIYVSNETQNINVFFDNLQVTHIRGPLLEETHYYPFGLTMSGISSKAAGGIENNKKYNGIEFDENLDLDTYEAYYRNLDPQTGRWWQIDPKVDQGMESVSPYASMYNDPILNSDFLGDEPDGCCKELLDNIYDGAVNVARTFNTYVNPLTPFVELASGKSVESDFNETKSRTTSASEAAITLIPGAKIEGALFKVGERVLGQGIEKQAVKAVEKYEVGTADNLVSRSVKGDGLDIHHVSQKQPAGQLIAGYDKAKAPAIALSQAEHKAIPTLKGATTAGNARQQLAKDVKDLRKYTNAPNQSLQKVIELKKNVSKRI